MVKKSALVILSGGLDSTTALYMSQNDRKTVKTITFDYGQKSASKEINAAKRISHTLNIPHEVFSLNWLSAITKTALVNTQADIPHPTLSDLDQFKQSSLNAQKVWVPNRNGLFLNIAATIAEAQGIDVIMTGFNAEEAVTFPDNSSDFLKTANDFFSYSTLSKVVVESPTLHMTKNQIASKAKDLAVPFSSLWFCYEGQETPCRACESCQRNFRAFQQVGIADPFKSS